MPVDPTGALKLDHGGKTYFFCSDFCEGLFVKEPATYLQRDGNQAPSLRPR